MLRWLIGIALAALLALGFGLFLPPNLVWREGGARALDGLTADAERGAYLIHAGGCIACHTDIKAKTPHLAGGPALATPFGTFYAPNITPHPEAGIGGWSTADFIRAMTQGISPEGAHYYPAFPYTSYTRMTTQDLVDLKAHLDTVEPVAETSRRHGLTYPFSERRAVAYWKALNFEPGAFTPDSTRSETWNRGAYLVTGPGHCGECHTPRDRFGGLTGRHLAGGVGGHDGTEKVPSIRATPDGIGDWSKGDIVMALKTGFTPDFDVLGGSMGAVISEGTSKLTDEDLAAMAEYLLSLDEPL
jgi:mono/diheme cytochrome c family protein